MLLSDQLPKLVGPLVQAVDVDRWTEIDRLCASLDPLGVVVALFGAELRLKGAPSADRCPCQTEGWL